MLSAHVRLDAGEGVAEIALVGVVDGGETGVVATLKTRHQQIDGVLKIRLFGVNHQAHLALCRVLCNLFQSLNHVVQLSHLLLLQRTRVGRPLDENVSRPGIRRLHKGHPFLKRQQSVSRRVHSLPRVGAPAPRLWPLPCPSDTCAAARASPPSSDRCPVVLWRAASRPSGPPWCRCWP